MLIKKNNIYREVSEKNFPIYKEKGYEVVETLNLYKAPNKKSK
jgi:hypothetical protein